MGDLREQDDLPQYNVKLYMLNLYYELSVLQVYFSLYLKNMISSTPCPLYVGMP